MDISASETLFKRSVERIYFQNEPQYTRCFVKKYQRQPALANRIFYLRVRLVDAVVSQFLRRPSSKTKVIVHLGCGSDALPWRSLHRNKDHCQRVKFVDVDSPDVIRAKCEAVKQNVELKEPLRNLGFHSGSRVVLTSDQLCQIACDLCQPESLKEVLSDVIDLSECECLFIAGTFFTQLEAGAADALISWAHKLEGASFCLVGQIPPNDPATPQQPVKPDLAIQSGVQYPTIGSQQLRFQVTGWPSVESWTLWEAWSDPIFMTPEKRQYLDVMEPFHNWEEFVYYASNHFMVYARHTAPSVTTASARPESKRACISSHVPSTPITFNYSPNRAPKRVSPRRFGAPMLLQDVLGQQFVANAFGQGPDGHSRSHDLYCKDADPEYPAQVMLMQGGPGARSCFTVTDLGAFGCLHVGGKTSLSEPFNDCWIFKKDVNQWVKTHSLPLPLFGHAAVRLGNSQLVLLAGGRSSAMAVHGDFLLYHPNIGWVQCLFRGNLRPPAVFGCLLMDTTASQPRCPRFRGVLAGGMTTDALISDAVYDWVLDVSDIARPAIEFAPATSQSSAGLLARYGAIATRVDGWTLVAGGVTSKGCLSQSDQIVRFDARRAEHERLERLDYATKLDPDTPRPIFTGASIIATDDGDIVLVGGGVSLLSTSAEWSRGVYSFNARALSSNDGSVPNNSRYDYHKTLTVTNEGATKVQEPSLQRVGLSSAVSIPRLRLESAEQFSSILHSAQPVVFEGLDLGPCLTLWGLPYLADRFGPERKIVVHDSTSQAMDFLAKNFRYATQTFKEFSDNVDAGKKLYLRALSTDSPSDTPARLDTDFPTISRDFILPPQLAFVQDRLFSSVLRVSGPVNMWLHYDVMANIYCQLQGTKRFCLFPPSDVTHLGFAPGASSSSIDVFSSLASSSLSHCHPYEAILAPGDVLFLPQLWLHTATPVSSSSIAVNVFFRDLDKGYSSGRDVYGNRDLAAYEKARQDVSRICKSFKDLPRDTRQFYLSRVADELQQIAAD